MPDGQVDLWARILLQDGAAKQITFDTDGFDPALLSCVRNRMKAWTVPDPGEITVDGPLKPRRVRSEPTPRP